MAQYSKATSIRLLFLVPYGFGSGDCRGSIKYVFAAYKTLNINSRNDYNLRNFVSFDTDMQLSAAFRSV